jgi:hypothetical protein
MKIYLASLLVLIGMFVLSQRPALGSTPIGGEYKATTTDATWSIATSQCRPGLVNNRTLGSVVITKTSNAVINIYDATTTGPHSNHATTTIASFPGVTAGTYTFDVALSRGLCVTVDTTVGVASSSITSR